MIPGKITFKGAQSTLKTIAPILKSAEEKKNVDAQIRKIINQSGTINTERISLILKTISDSIEAAASAKSLDIDVLKKALGLYQDCSHTQENIQGLLGPQVEKLLEIYEDFTTIKDLIHRGVIMKTDVLNTIESED